MMLFDRIPSNLQMCAAKSVTDSCTDSTPDGYGCVDSGIVWIKGPQQFGPLCRYMDEPWYSRWYVPVIGIGLLGALYFFFGRKRHAS